MTATEPEEPKPLPCPFCGSIPRVVPPPRTRSFWSVECGTSQKFVRDHFAMMAALSRAVAVEMWNRRSEK